ncbi:MAG: alpha/beta hydrolase [Promethearchaeota archaeon]|nr:MAG: alpha/beta hydrolase [Candidatus Lokiarchaeota archaeon]
MPKNKMSIKIINFISKISLKKQKKVSDKVLHQTGYFEGRETRKLFYQSWRSESEQVKAYIIAIHGWGTHSDRISVPAEFLTDKGYDIFAFDLRGHWRNAGDSPGHIDSMDHIQKDIVLFSDLVKKEAGGKKIFLMGHSFGGLISLIYAINHPGLNGIMVSSPLLKLKMELSIANKLGKKLAKPLSKLSPTKMVSMEIDQNLLTSDLKILRKHISDDKKLEQISLRTAAELENSMKWAMNNADKLLCPIFIMQAGNDKLVEKTASKKFYEAIRYEDKQYKEYPGFLHELWNEKGRVQVYRDMYIWLEKHLK